MQIIHPHVVKGNSYPIYFHVHCGESSKRHGGKYDDPPPFLSHVSGPGQQLKFTSVSLSVRGHGTFSSVCLRAFGGSHHPWCRGWERRCVEDLLPVRGGLLCQFPTCWAPQRTYAAPLFRSASQSQFYTLSQVPPWGSGHLVPSPSLRMCLMLGLMLLALLFLVGINSTRVIECVCVDQLFSWAAPLVQEIAL